MRIVKPYGVSESHADEGKPLERFLHANSFPAQPVAVREFARTHPALVIAQWISCIDKIITRPHGDGKPSPEQWALRNTLGHHAWDVIVALDLLSAPEGRKKRLERQWWSRVHPYGAETDLATPRNYRGRWYAVFAEGFDSTNFDAKAVARKIYDHLYVAEFRMRPDGPPKRQGLLVSRAESISKNVLRSTCSPDPLAPPWSEADKAVYAAVGDVAQTLVEVLKGLEGQREATLRRRCAAILQDHVLRVFNDNPTLQAARSEHTGCHALHQAIRESYRSILKSDHRHLAKKLPPSIEALFKLVERKFLNRQVNALVRLGRVIHYQATPQGALSHTSNVVRNWPDDISASSYWTSSGQKDIKRNEAFVKVWRGMLSIASRTLTDWADPERSVPGDILGARELHRAISGIGSDAYDRKARLLFGNRSARFTEVAIETKQDILRLGLESIRHLRNSAFHFVGIGGFLTTIMGLEQHGSTNTVAAVNELWREDAKKRDGAIRAGLKAANAEYFLSESQFDALAAAIEATRIQITNLPALRHILDRAADAWTFGKYRLSLPPRHSGPEDLAQECQYIALKLLYQRSFALWLRSISSDLLGAYVDRSISRTTIEARRATQNDKVDARTTGRFKIVAGDTIFVFFSRLEAALTAEARESSGTQIQRQKSVKYLTSLQCDVIAQAFEDFLRDNNFTWLFADFSGREPRAKQFEIPPHDALDDVTDPQPWQSILYFLLHLIPVDDVNKLAHQLGRFIEWTGLNPVLLQQLQEVLDLYQVMHDAKFTGEGEYLDAFAFSSLYETPASVPRVSRQESERQSRTESLPRGMRELFRFGDTKTLSTVFADHLISDHDIGQLKALQSAIAAAQGRRAELHALWVSDGHLLSADLIQEYSDLVLSITKFRHLSGQVRLLNHLRLHRLLMSVLTRLVDYAGQWERDLYFVSLAVIYLRRSTPAELFSLIRGRHPIATGQIIQALRNMAESTHASHLRNVIRISFGISMPGVSGESVTTRNNLMHFNCLHSRSTAIDLTELVNQTRSLMSYDRKLKNAVSKSVIDILDRNGMRLLWRFDGQLLSAPTITSREISHLGNQKVSEELNGDRYVSMVRQLF
jgi:hypothetical protein